MAPAARPAGLERISARVLKGMELLDRRVPGWERWVNAERLDQHSPIDSVLGQVFGDEVEGCAVLGLSQTAEIAHGFRPDSPIDHGQAPPEAFTQFTAYWQVAVLARRTVNQPAGQLTKHL